MKYAYSADGENYDAGELDSREAAALEHVSGNADYEPGEETWVWTCEIVRPTAGEFAPGWHELHDCLTDSERNEQPDCAAGWLDGVTPAKRVELEEMVAAAIEAWADKHGLQPKWFVAKNPEKTVVVVPREQTA